MFWFLVGSGLVLAVVAVSVVAWYFWTGARRFPGQASRQFAKQIAEYEWAAQCAEQPGAQARLLKTQPLDSQAPNA